MLGSFVLALVVGYLLGAVPNGYLLGKLVAGVDVRTQGTGKTGASNTRTLLGWRRGFFPVFLLDASKGAAAVLLASWTADGLNPWVRVAGGMAAIIGHSWPVYLGFKGGRGVATGIGVMLMLLPHAMLVVALVAVPAVFLSGYISVGSIVGAILLPLVALLAVALFDHPWPYFYFATVAGILVVVWHKDNIERLLAGTERRI